MRKELVLPVTAAVSGAAGFFLRRWELASAFEADTGLPIPGMPATWALIALSAAAVLALALLCRGSHRVFPGGYDEAFSARGRTLYMAGMVAAAFLMVIAGALFLMELPQLYAEAKLQTKGTPMLGLLPRALLAVLALCSGWSLFQLGKNNYRGEGQGKYSSSLLIPAYTACMWLIVAYQARSGDPIILDYVYQLLLLPVRHVLHPGHAGRYPRAGLPGPVSGLFPLFCRLFRGAALQRPAAPGTANAGEAAFEGH